MVAQLLFGIRHSGKLTLLLLGLTLVCHAQNNLPADEQALRAFAEQYFVAYEKRDLEAFMALWTGLEADRKRQRDLMERRFATEESHFAPRTITRLNFRFSSGEVCVKTERTTKAIPGVTTRHTPLHVCWTMAKEEVWRIVREQPAVMDFAARFQSSSEEERENLLATETEFVTPELARVLASFSEQWMGRTNYAAALQTHNALRRVLVKLNDQPALAEAWHESGLALQLLKRYAESFDAFAKALALETQLNRPAKQAQALTSLATSRRFLQQYDQAMARYAEALTLYQSLNERGETAATLEAIATLHYERGDYERAIQGYRDSLAALPAEPATLTAANRWLKLAQIEYESGDNAAALASFQQTLTLYDRLDFRKSHGFIYHSIANLFYGQGDFAQAVRYYQQSLAVEQANHNDVAQASAYQGIGLAQSFNGNYAAALTAFEQQLALWQKRNDPYQIAAALQRVASTRYSLQQLAEALPLYEEVERMRAKLGDANEHARALLDLGITLAGLGKLDEAMQRYEQSRAQFTVVQNAAGIANVLVNVATLRYAQENYLQALRDADEASQLARQVKNNDILWQALYRRGKSQYRLQQLPAARQTLNEAAALVEAQRSTPTSGLLLTGADQQLKPHLALLDVLVSLNLVKEAFQLSERIKTRELFHILRNGRLWVTQTMTPPEREREAQHLKTLALLNAQIAREHEKQSPSETRLVALRQQRQQAETAYDVFLRALYQTHPRLAALRSEAPALNAPRAAALVRDARTVALSFIESDESFFLFAFAQNAANQPATLRAYQLNTYRSLLEARLKENDPALARKLYDLLLLPAQAQLAGKTRIFVAPSRVLWNISFEALRGAADRALGQQAAIRYVPSLTAWQTVQNQPRLLAQRSTARLTILHAPQWSDETRARWQSATGQALPDEKTSLPWIHTQRDAKLLTGTAASLSQVGDSLQLHLAAPFFRNEYSPLFSAFALSENTRAHDNGWVELRVLPYRKTARQLVSLIDTTTGLHEGRAWLGAYWTLFLSGSPAILLMDDATQSPLSQRSNGLGVLGGWRWLGQ